MAHRLGGCLWRLAARVARVIRVDALWLSIAPLDMRAGMDTLLAQVVQVFGEARPHHAYLFANRRGTRMKVLIHDGQGIWLACRRLNQGRFRWADGNGSLTLSQAQFDALVLGLPWQQLSGDGAIRMI
ncbi:IS66 family insertion sequence element accessory protein TnpB [Zoogloea sp. 1C4]|uniref:IS66 family insertion sequence element accessory protein TnpB n=1 Tax=Zoogloea sp. 1C4 TaxID=2570190 RepID=UPI0012923FE5|nr:IS66 family insertion sequence element accessory protein TnpB [Zoogloea sp. 1C4]